MTFILAALLAFTFTSTITDVKEPVKNESSYVYVSKQVHDEQQASFNGMLNELETTLATTQVLNTSQVKAHTRAVSTKHMPCETADVEEANWCKENRNELTRRLYASVTAGDFYREKATSEFHDKVASGELFLSNPSRSVFSSMFIKSNSPEQIQHEDLLLKIIIYFSICLAIFAASKDYYDENKKKVDNAVITAYSVLIKHYIAVIIIFVTVLYPLLLLSFIV